VGPLRCPETASGQHAPENQSGKCDWCGARVAPPFRPSLDHRAKSELDDAYGYHWDPDHRAQDTY
jgi:hypothetical protein